MTDSPKLLTLGELASLMTTKVLPAVSVLCQKNQENPDHWVSHKILWRTALSDAKSLENLLSSMYQQEIWDKEDEKTD